MWRLLRRHVDVFWRFGRDDATRSRDVTEAINVQQMMYRRYSRRVGVMQVFDECWTWVCNDQRIA